MSDDRITDGELSPQLALRSAHDLIVSAGFDLKYTSLSGSHYYHLSGRTGGTLRLSDHSMEKPEGVVAMLTIHAANMPRNNHKLQRMVAETIGYYMLGTNPTGTETYKLLQTSTQDKKSNQINTLSPGDR